MIEPKFDEKQLPTEEEVAKETESFLNRSTLCYQRIADADYNIDWMLYPVNSAQRGEVAEIISHYFHRETQFDFRPYSAGEENEDHPVYLVRSKRFTTCVPIIAGAFGLERVQGNWVLTWIWIHPWERGTRLVGAVFDTLDETYGSFYVEEPVSGAMRGLMAKRKYDEKRIVTIERY